MPGARRPCVGHVVVLCIGANEASDPHHVPTASGVLRLRLRWVSVDFWGNVEVSGSSMLHSAHVCRASVRYGRITKGLAVVTAPMHPSGLRYVRDWSITFDHRILVWVLPMLLTLSMTDNYSTSKSKSEYGICLLQMVGQR